MTTQHIEKQQERFQKLLQLIKENPNLRIVPMVESEIVADDYYAYWIGNWGEAKIDEIYCSGDNERIYIRSEDEESLIDEVFNRIEAIETNKYLSDDELYKKAEKEVESYNWEKVIVVYITL